MKVKIAIIALAAFALPGLAHADLKTKCEAVAAADAAGNPESAAAAEGFCGCLVDKSKDDAAVTAELEALAGESLETRQAAVGEGGSASDGAKAAVAACAPQQAG